MEGEAGEPENFFTTPFPLSNRVPNLAQQEISITKYKAQ